MAKRKFLICFPYEGDVKKIDKIADALESEGIDFMQVDGETPSGEFVSVAKGDIDEVKEDIAEIPGFEGTMEALDDLTIMPTEGEFTDVEFPESDEDFIAKLKANPDDDEVKYKQKVRVNLKFDDYVKDALGPDADVSTWWVEGTWQGLEGPSDDMPVVAVDYDEELFAGMNELFPELSDDEAWEKVQSFCDENDYLCGDGEIWIPLKPDFTTDEIRQPFPKDEDEIIATDTTEDDNKFLEGWDFDEDGFFDSKFYEVYTMWYDGFVDRISDLGDIYGMTDKELKNKIDRMIPTNLQFEKMNLKLKIIEDRLESYPEVETFMIDPMNGTYHFRLKDFPNIDISATPGWEADDYETLMSVPVSLNVVDYDGVKDDEIPKEYEKEKWIINVMEDEVLWHLGNQSYNNNGNPYSLEDPVWDPARGKYISYEVYADLYYKKLVKPLLGELYMTQESYSGYKEAGDFGKGGGIGYQEINKGKKSTKKSKQDNSALLGGLAGLVLGIFLNR